MSPELGRRLIVLIAVVSFVGTVFSVLFGQEIDEPQHPFRDSYDRGPLGHHGIWELFPALGVAVKRARTPRYFEAEEALWFIEPRSREVEVSGRKFEIGDVVRQRAEHGKVSVVVLPKWQLRQMMHQGEQIDVVVAEWEETIDNIMQSLFQGGDASPGIKRSDKPVYRSSSMVVSGPLGRYDVRLPWPQTIEDGNEFEPLLSSDQGVWLARVSYAKAAWYLITDPDLVHNFSFHRAQHAVLIDSLLSRETDSDSVLIDEVFHGYGFEPSLAASLARFPNNLLLIHLLAIGLVVVVMGWKRFGPRQQQSAALGRGPVEAIDATAGVMKMGQRAGSMAREYVELQVSSLCGKLGIAPNKKTMYRDVDKLLSSMGLRPWAQKCIQKADELAFTRTNSNGGALRLTRRCWSHVQETLKYRR